MGFMLITSCALCFCLNFNMHLPDSSLTIGGLFALLAFLLNDLIFDNFGDSGLKTAYYCFLYDSFGTVAGIMRLGIPSFLLVFGILQSLNDPRKNRHFIITQLLILSFIGLPLFIVNLYLVSRACSNLTLFPGTQLMMSHYAMLILFIAVGFLSLIQSKPKNKSFCFLVVRSIWPICLVRFLFKKYNIATMEKEKVLNQA